MLRREIWSLTSSAVIAFHGQTTAAWYQGCGSFLNCVLCAQSLFSQAQSFLLMHANDLV